MTNYVNGNHKYINNLVEQNINNYTKELCEINIMNDINKTHIESHIIHIFYNTSVQSNSFINLNKDIDKILNLSIMSLFDMKASLIETSFNFCNPFDFKYIKIYCLDNNGIYLFMDKVFPLNKDILTKIIYVLTRKNCYVSKYRDFIDTYIKDNNIMNSLIYY